VPLKIIGTGFGRTGTDSMRHALNLLGAGPTHHMYELGENPVLRDGWRALAQGAAPDWEVLFAGYPACVDWPSAFYWKTLINVYPEAKVLLTWRSAESWWGSFEATILQHIRKTTDRDNLAISLIAEQVFGGRPDQRDHAILVYERNVEEVQATVPAGRLLVHKLGDGWAPLCRFLDLPVPQVDYPSGNASTEFQSRVTGP
jgi:hypothetical protein